jgi:hypothetical protein
MDSYVNRHGITTISLVKCDVEGAELSVLQGARNILEAENRPMWILEINNETSRGFGYTPADMLGLLSGCGYQFYAIRRKLEPVRSTVGYHHGDNVIAVVPSLHEELLNARL